MFTTFAARLYFLLPQVTEFSSSTQNHV